MRTAATTAVVVACIANTSYLQGGRGGEIAASKIPEGDLNTKKTKAGIKVKRGIYFFNFFGIYYH